jgi:chromosome partitioning protein
MKIISVVSLSGGQGKTTITVLLARVLARAGISCLAVDADPQANLTTFLGLDIQDTDPTLLEVLKNSVGIDDAVYPVEGENDLFIIPADDGLDTAQDYLSTSGVGALLLKQRLQALADDFKVCLIDSPPQRSQIIKSVIGATDYAVLPCEATVKGVGSLIRTLSAIDELRELSASHAELLGVVPFRDKWVGANQTSQSQLCIEQMREEVGKSSVLPSIRESERYKQAISEGMTLMDMGYIDLQYPIDELLHKIKEIL